MIDTVVFDLFGVIAHHQSEAGKDRLVAVSGVPAAAFWEAYWAHRAPYDSGAVSATSYWTTVAAALGTTFDAARTARLVEADVASWDAVDDAMVAVVRDTAATGLRIGLLSNIPEELAVYYEAHHPWLDVFAVRGFSCRIGHAKPRPEAYRWCCTALDRAPDRVLFIDDRRDNIDAAAAVGLGTHLFTGADAVTERIRGIRTG
jgi:putative hydrolase of the HAD superfamily